MYHLLGDVTKKRGRSKLNLPGPSPARKQNQALLTTEATLLSVPIVARQNVSKLEMRALNYDSYSI